MRKETKGVLLPLESKTERKLEGKKGVTMKGQLFFKQEVGLLERRPAKKEKEMQKQRKE